MLLHVYMPMQLSVECRSILPVYSCIATSFELLCYTVYFVLSLIRCGIHAHVTIRITLYVHALSW